MVVVMVMLMMKEYYVYKMQGLGKYSKRHIVFTKLREKS